MNRENSPLVSAETASCDLQLCLTSQEQSPPRQLVSGVCMCTYVYMNMHAYLCVCAVVTSEGRRQRCRQVNPTLGLSIQLSDQRINNSDSSLSGSITEHRLRGRQRHNKGTEVIYSLIQFTHTQIKVDADSLRNCAPMRSLKSQPRIHTRNAQKQGNMRIHKFSHTQRATP